MTIQAWPDVRRRELACSALLLFALFLMASLATSAEETAAGVSAQCSDINSCVRAIQNSVTRNWNRAADGDGSLTVRLKVTLRSDAVVNGVEIAATSGSRPFDHSAVNAVLRAAEFPELRGLDRDTYEKNFRTFYFDFAPGPRPVPTPDILAYEHAFQLLKTGQYADGASAFAAFLTQYPESSRADYGLYWLGEAQYVVRNYVEAANNFEKLIGQYPKSRKVSEALLRLASSNNALGKYADARQNLERVIQLYPGTVGAHLATKQLGEMASAGH